MKALSFIADLLHANYGFDASQPETLRRTVNERLAATGLKTTEEYGLLLEGSREEQEALLEAVIVPETYFFRHPESFAALVDWAKTHSRRPLRILSAACSTGEEAYSAAMALLDAGFSPGDFRIEACDISPESIRMARRGIYTGKAFRSPNLDWRDRYFIPVSEGWSIKPALLDLVRFRLGNLFDRDMGSGWDAIFCRNVMIYFSAARQKQLITILGNALAKDGLLFLGPAEPPLFLAAGWASLGRSMSFVYTKQSVPRPPVPAPAPAPTPVVIAKPAWTKPAAVPSSPAVTPPPADPASERSVENARRLADSGRLEAAREMLEGIVQADADDTDAWFLSGVVAEAQLQDNLAEAHYRKALYLAPDHEEALKHMELLLDRHGRSRAAANLRRRALKHSLPS